MIRSIKPLQQWRHLRPLRHRQPVETATRPAGEAVPSRIVVVVPLHLRQHWGGDAGFLVIASVDLQPLQARGGDVEPVPNPDDTQREALKRGGMDGDVTVDVQHRELERYQA